MISQHETSPEESNESLMDGTRTGGWSALKSALELNTPHCPSGESLDLARKVAQLVALNRLSLQISKTLEESEVVRIGLERVDQVVRSQFRAILAVDGESREILSESVLGECPEVEEYLRSHRDVAVVPAFLEALGGIVYIHDLSECANLLPVSPCFSAHRSLVVIPIAAAGSFYGILVLIGLPGEEYSSGDVELIEAIGNHIGIAVGNARLHQELSHLAITDGLTELYNHRYFYQRLSEEFKRARAFGRPLSLLFIDVDDLREVNDANGHLTGDRVLRELGRLAKENVRGTDIVARYGGDEFTVILPESSEAQAEMLARRLQSAVSNASLLGTDSSTAVTISIGIARLTDEVANEFQLVNCADQAAYRAKGLGKNTLAVHGRD